MIPRISVFGRGVDVVSDGAKALGQRFAKVDGQYSYSTYASLYGDPTNQFRRNLPRINFEVPDKEITDNFRQSYDDTSLAGFERFMLEHNFTSVTDNRHIDSNGNLINLVEVGAVYTPEGKLVGVWVGDITQADGSLPIHIPSEKTHGMIVTHLHPTAMSPSDPQNLLSVPDIRSHVKDDVLETRAVNDFNTVSLKNVSTSEKIDAVSNGSNTFHQHFQEKVAEKHKSMIDSGTYGKSETFTDEITYSYNWGGEQYTKTVTVTYTVTVEKNR